jgi:hypothetical protein
MICLRRWDLPRETGVDAIIAADPPEWAKEGGSVDKSQKK